jgi:hypothetical protein
MKEFRNAPIPIALRAVAVVVLLIGSSFSSTARAHRSSNAFFYLDTQPNPINGTFDFAIRDLEAVVQLDENGDRAITWNELKAGQKRVAEFISSHIDLSGSGEPCAKKVSGNIETVRRSDGIYARQGVVFTCSHASGDFQFVDRALFDIDSDHRVLLEILTKEMPSIAWPNGGHLAASGTPLREFIYQGIFHILSGIDHIFFLLTLLIQVVNDAVRRRKDSELAKVQWLPNMIRVITAFTVAHSLVLVLVSLNIWEHPLPSPWIEAGIAATVVLSALNNLLNFFRGPEWFYAFGFGLVHGMGLASIFLDLGLRGRAAAAPLIGFNMGIEFGQLLIVGIAMGSVVILPPGVQKTVLRFGSFAVLIVSVFWLAERSLAIKVF